MKTIFRFHASYFLLSLGLLGLEILIGGFLHDSIIRPYGGDFLVVILLYCFARSFLDLPVIPVALSVLVFSYLVETMQYFNLADRLHLKAHSLARIVLGTSFSWADILSYTLGILLVLMLEGKAGSCPVRRIA
ncbi:ribosomal maturation YjgA family protein [Flavitalea flava]